MCDCKLPPKVLVSKVMANLLVRVNQNDTKGEVIVNLQGGDPFSNPDLVLKISIVHTLGVGNLCHRSHVVVVSGLQKQALQKVILAYLLSLGSVILSIIVGNYRVSSCRFRLLDWRLLRALGNRFLYWRTVTLAAGLGAI